MSPAVDDHQETAEPAHTVYGDSYNAGDIQDSVVAIGEGARAEIHQYTEIIVKLDTIEDLPPADGDPPFKGLAYFSEADADIFFGREELSDKLVARLQTSGALAVIGASGSGKSSLLRAGVVPRLRAQNWLIRILTPAAHPLERLANTLTLDDDSLNAAGEMQAALAQNSQTLHLAANKIAGGNDASHLLLVVDQFEELFTLCRDEAERQAFLDNLFTAAGAGGAAALLIGLRADFYDHALQYEELRTLLAQQQEPIGPMRQEELVRVIAEPAKRGGWQFVEGLVEQILEDIGREPGRLPLLSHALLETWERLRGTVMTLARYRAAGGVEGAIAKTAEDTLKLLEPTQVPIVEHIFLSLTELGEGSEDTRRIATRAELMRVGADETAVASVLEELVRARLVTLDGEHIEVAHEALIRRWPRLHNWLQENRERLRFERQLAHDAAEWFTELQQDPGALYRGARLAQALEWADRDDLVLDDLSRQFLENSRNLAQRQEQEREEQRQRELQQQRALAAEQLQRAEEAEAAESRQKRLTRIALGVLIVALVAAVLAVYLGMQSQSNAQEAASNLETAEFNEQQAFMEGTRAADSAAVAVANEKEAFAQGTIAAGNAAAAVAESTRAAENLVQAERQQRLAEARELAARSSAVLGRDYGQGLSYAYQAVQKTYEVDETITGEAYAALQSALTTVGRPLAVLKGHSVRVNLAAFSADGTRIVTASNDNTARLWDGEGQPLTVLEGHIGPVWSAVYSPDGMRILSASGDGTARMWDGEGQPLTVLEGHTKGVNSAAFSADGTRIVTASNDNTARLWDGEGQPLTVLEGHIGPVNMAAFSLDGTLIVTASNDNTARLWDGEGQPLTVLEGHSSYVESAAFSVDGTRIVTASFDGTARLWDEKGQLLAVLEGHTDLLWSAAFNPDGTHIVTASRDGTARLWDEQGQPLVVLEGHTAPVISAVFSPDGTQIVTASIDSTARLWDDEGNPLAVLEGHSEAVWSAVFSAVGTRIVTTSDRSESLSGDNTARLWGGERQPKAVLKGHTGGVNSARFTADGKRIVTASWDGWVGLWNDEGQPEEMLAYHATPVDLALLSADGERIVTATTRGWVEMWDDEGQRLEAPGGDLAAINADGTRIVTVEDNVARLWDENGQMLSVLNGQVDWANAQALSTDGTRIVTAGEENTARLWDDDGQELAVLQGHTDWITSAAFNADGTRIVTASRDKTARLWDAEGHLLAVLAGHTDEVNSAAFSADGRQLVTASSDDTARLWDLEGQPLGVLEGHTDRVLSAAFSPDGKWIVTGSNDNTARLWRNYPDVESMLVEAEKVLISILSSPECEEIIRSEACLTDTPPKIE